MKKILAVLIFVSCGISKISAQVPKIISDCTIYFNISVNDEKADPAVVKAMSGSSKVLYIKGFKSRSELETPNFKQIIIYDSKTDSTIVLRELGKIKYISYLNPEIRKEKNKRYEGIKFTKTNEKKTILGYECIKVVATLLDSSTYDVYYSPSIIPSNKEYEYQFKDIPGFVLEYETQSENGKTKIKYSASKITLLPVPVAKFDIPKSGYRVL